MRPLGAWSVVPASWFLMRHLLACGRCVEFSQQDFAEGAENLALILAGNLLPESCQRQTRFVRIQARGEQRGLRGWTRFTSLCVLPTLANPLRQVQKG